MEGFLCESRHYKRFSKGSMNTHTSPVQWILSLVIIAGLSLGPIMAGAQQVIDPAVNEGLETSALPLNDIAEDDVNDPYEKINRKVYSFNEFMDRALLIPVTKFYRKAIPELGREGIANFLRNLATPVTLINNVFQGDGNQAFISFWRFTLNTTFGIGGLSDFAGDWGLRDRVEDFGQTAGTYGVGSGPYLILPFYGPSTVRDGAGRVVDLFLDPFSYLLPDELTIARMALDGIETRSQTLSLTDEIKRTSLDPYATLRSLYLQSRVDQIHNGTVVPELEDYDQ